MDYELLAEIAGKALLAAGLAAAVCYFFVTDRRDERKRDQQQRDEDEGVFGS